MLKFGEFYLRRRVVPDFIYDAARLYHLVLVGYSANDPPMRYLLNAVAADGNRFDDLKERFTFFGTTSPDAVALADWNGRGITPIHYDSTNSHNVLRATLEQWAALSAINGKKETVDAELRRIVKLSRSADWDPRPPIEDPSSENEVFDLVPSQSHPPALRRPKADGHHLWTSVVGTTCGRQIRRDLEPCERLEVPEISTIFGSSWLGNLDSNQD